MDFFQLKAYFYLVLTALEDAETQKRGFVVILYHMGPMRSDIDPELPREGPISGQWLPVRFCAIHLCMDNPMMKVIAKVMLVAAGQEFRSRFRLHEGTLV